MGTSAFFSFRTWNEVKVLVRRNRPAIAILQNVFPLISPSVYYALRSEGIPIIQLVYNYRFVCPDAHLFSCGEICERCIPGNYWHAVRRKCYRNSYSLSAWYAGNLRVHRALGSFARNADIFMIPDRFMKGRLVAGGIPADKIRINVNPFFVEDYQPSRESGDFILYVGRLVRQKGVFTLVRAMSQLPFGPPLYIVGDGESRNQLEALISDLNLTDRVTLLGPRWGRELELLIQKSRFLIVPSEWYDNLPLIICQAYALAKPVIASAINGIPEYVQNGVDGLLFEAGNPAALAQCIDVLNKNSALICEMGRNARRKAERVLDFRTYWQTLDGVIRELVN